jgi:hypothetical protein
MVQNFAFFADRLGASKIRTAKSLMGRETFDFLHANDWRGCGLDVRRHEKKITKISSEGLTCNSAKFCTSKNFPL